MISRETPNNPTRPRSRHRKPRPQIHPLGTTIAAHETHSCTVESPHWWDMLVPNWGRYYALRSFDTLEMLRHQQSTIKTSNCNPTPTVLEGFSSVWTTSMCLGDQWSLWPPVYFLLITRNAVDGSPSARRPLRLRRCRIEDSVVDDDAAADDTASCGCEPRELTRPNGLIPRLRAPADILLRGGGLVSGARVFLSLYVRATLAAFCVGKATVRLRASTAVRSEINEPTCPVAAAGRSAATVKAPACCPVPSCMCGRGVRLAWWRNSERPRRRVPLAAPEVFPLLRVPGARLPLHATTPRLSSGGTQTQESSDCDRTGVRLLRLLRRGLTAKGATDSPWKTMAPQSVSRQRTRGSYIKAAVRHSLWTTCPQANKAHDDA